MTALILVVTLALYPPGVVLLHRLGQGRAEKRAGRRLPTQGITLKAVLFALLLVCGGLVPASWLGKIPVAWSVWLILVAGGMGYCYWLLVCVTESARRYMIAELISKTPGITPAEIVRQYNRHQIIAARLERLEHWGTLRREGDRYRSHLTLMLTASILTRSWARLLGFGWARALKKGTSHS